MKKLDIYVMEEDFTKVTDILCKNNVVGMAFDEVQGAGRMKRTEIRERDGWDVKTVTPEYERRTRIETVVPDSLANKLSRSCEHHEFGE